MSHHRQRGSDTRLERSEVIEGTQEISSSCCPAVSNIGGAAEGGAVADALLQPARPEQRKLRAAAGAGGPLAGEGIFGSVLVVGGVRHETKTARAGICFGGAALGVVHQPWCRAGCDMPVRWLV